MVKIGCVFLTIAFLLLSLLSVSSVRADNSVIERDISSTQDLIKDCYNAVKEAEAKGADITTLIIKLNDAAKLLAQAELAYSIGDYDFAASCLSQSNNRLTGLVSEATALEELARINSNQDSVITMLSVIGSLSILGVGTAVVMALKQKERKDLNGYSTV